MKKNINEYVLSLLILSLTLSACSSPGEKEKTSSSSSVNGVKLISSSGVKNLSDKQQLDLTGRWQWQASIKEEKVSMGFFDIKDNQDGTISGITAPLPGLDKSFADLKKMPDPLKETTYKLPFEGQKKGNSLEFAVKDENGLITRNKAIVSTEGNFMTMTGQSFQQVRADNPILDKKKPLFQLPINSNIKKINYNWVAVKW